MKFSPRRASNLCTLCIFIGLLWLGAIKGTFPEIYKQLIFTTSSREDSPNVHLLVPTNKANKGMCRTLISAIVNDYPDPILINWARNKGDKSMNGYDMTTGKIWGVLKYLRSLPPQSDNDLVIMVDANDVVFQLPLDIMLKRYQESNDQATSRLMRQHGQKEMLVNGLAQTILLGAEKHCWPLSHSHPACWAVPESALRSDAYGNLTDQSTETNRPRWLNSGNIIGPVRDMRKLYEWAHTLWMSYDVGGGDQDYFSNIYGRQELSRQRLRGSKEWIFGFGEHLEESELTFPNMETQHTDYHMGLDLASEVFQSLDKAHDELSSVVHGNLTDLEAKDIERGTREIYRAQFPFPKDLIGLPFPVKDPINHNHNYSLSWRDVRLFSNFHARSIPAVLHYNGDKSVMDNWWQRQWWTGHGREIIHSKTSSNSSHLELKTDDVNNALVGLSDICAEFENDVFVDAVELWQ